jgi:hypothetical protein
MVRRALPAGDYATTVADQIVACVERKSLADLVSSISGNRLKYQLADLAALPRAAIVVEDRYASMFKLDRIRPAVVADALAELQIAWRAIPIVFTDTRPLAEEWTYRWLAAAARHTLDDTDATTRLADLPTSTALPSTAQVRAWARTAGLDVPPRGRLSPGIRGGLPSATHTARVAGPGDDVGDHGHVGAGAAGVSRCRIPRATHRFGHGQPAAGRGRVDARRARHWPTGAGRSTKRGKTLLLTGALT